MKGSKREESVMDAKMGTALRRISVPEEGQEKSKRCAEADSLKANKFNFLIVLCKPK